MRNQESFLKTEKKSRIDYQFTNALFEVSINHFFILPSFHIKNEYSAQAGINRRLQNLFSIQTFKLVNYSLTSYFRCPASRIPLGNFGVLSPGSHLRGPRSRVPLDHIEVPGPGSHLWGPGSRVPPMGPASRFSGPTFPICRTLLCSCK